MAIVDSNVNLGSVCYPKKDATASPPPGLTSVAPIARRSLTPDQDYYLGSHSVENPFIQHIGSFNSTDGSTEPAKWTEILSPQCIQSQPEPVNALALNTANADEALPEERRLSQSSSLVDMFEQSTLSPENDLTPEDFQEFEAAALAYAAGEPPQLVLPQAQVAVNPEQVPSDLSQFAPQMALLQPEQMHNVVQQNFNPFADDPRLLPVHPQQGIQLQQHVLSPLVLGQQPVVSPPQQTPQMWPQLDNYQLSFGFQQQPQQQKQQPLQFGGPQQPHAPQNPSHMATTVAPPTENGVAPVYWPAFFAMLQSPQGLPPPPTQSRPPGHHAPGATFMNVQPRFSQPSGNPSSFLSSHFSSAQSTPFSGNLSGYSSPPSSMNSSEQKMALGFSTLAVSRRREESNMGGVGPIRVKSQESLSPQSRRASPVKSLPKLEFNGSGQRTVSRSNRAEIACNACKRRKVGCCGKDNVGLDGKCETCRKYGDECVFADTVRRRGKARPKTNSN